MTEPATTPRRQRSLLRRIFSLPNVLSVAGGLVVFALVERAWPTTTGALIAAAIGGAFSALVWLLWNRARGLRPVGKLIDLPHIGHIPATPDSPTPTLTAPGSAASVAYQRAASRLEASTKGRVLLVSGMQSGQGATTASLNLAIAATRAGRRTLLIDGDIRQARLSRFGRTGRSPGLAELSRGDAELADAARMWSIDAASRLPFIPAGAAGSDADIDRRGLAAAVEDLTTAADLVLIDTSANGDSLDALGALADGTLLVLPRAAGQAPIDAARQRVERAGAPAIGYVINDAAPSPPSIHQHPVLRSLKRGLATAVLVLVAYGAWNGFQIWSSWSGVERQGLDVAAASELLPLPEEGISDEGLGEETRTAVTAPLRAEGDFLSMLIVGTDLSEELADVIVLVIVPANGDEPVMVSLPRDLYLPNRCSQSYARLNSTLAGCGDEITGASLLALTVEDFTGIPVDHFALFTFEGFERIIDQVGGVEICVEYPVRDAKAELDLPAGCTQADGAQALSWVRSRRTQELVDGRWRTMEDVSDLTRNERQQEVILEMFDKLARFSSVNELNATVRRLTSAFELDDQLGISDAINLAWDLRGIDPATVVTLEMPVTDRVTDAGAQVLVPALSFDQVLADAYPDMTSAIDD
jgi:LCP family protein required for cell wall assembly